MLTPKIHAATARSILLALGGQHKYLTHWISPLGVRITSLTCTSASPGWLIAIVLESSSLKSLLASVLRVLRIPRDDEPRPESVHAEH